MAKRISEKLLTKSPATNKGLAKAGLMYFVSTFVLYLKLVLRIEHCAKMPCLRQAPNRYRQAFGTLLTLN
jgi:hypothetical protein